MTTTQISSNSISINTAYANPYSKSEQPSTTTQANLDAQKSAQVAKSDTVTISQQAIQKANETKEYAEKKRSDNEARENKQGTSQYPNIR